MLGFDAFGELDYGRESGPAAAYPGGAPPTRADAPTDEIALQATMARDGRAERRRARA